LLSFEITHKLTLTAYAHVRNVVNKKVTSCTFVMVSMLVSICGGRRYNVKLFTDDVIRANGCAIMNDAMSYDREPVYPTTVRVPESIHKPARVKAADLRVSMQRVMLAMLARWAGVAEAPKIPGPELLAESLSVPIPEQIVKNSTAETESLYTVRYASQEHHEAGQRLRAILESEQAGPAAAVQEVLRSVEEVIRRSDNTSEGMPGIPRRRGRKSNPG
jgi:hypothetical protein